MSDNALNTFITRTRTGNVDGTNDLYDHAISLVDSTNPENNIQNTQTRSDSPPSRKITRVSTRGSVRDTLNRRKYAKWRQERFEAQDNGITHVEEHEGEVDQPNTQTSHGKQDVTTETADFAHTDATTPKAQHKSSRRQKQENYAIDILYENQRGWFFCGIPLYSHSSLLNFDPGPWVTKEYKDSAVNITNAQVPDPSWQWDWKHWYVDMSGDVDEDGWQYSFAFFGNFAWHGTHPWFHSYVRRRRWLRRRIKKHALPAGKPLPSSMSQAHKLNADYFTIHSARARSPGRGIDGGPQTARPESYMSFRSYDSIENEMPEQIDNIASLLKAMHLSSVDREKIDAVKKFVASGGEELAYLKEQIPEIMSLLVFQNSRRQLLEFIRQKADELKKHRDEHDAENKPEGEAEARLIDNLLQAVEVANKQIDGLEYWSDRKHILMTTEDEDLKAHKPISTIFDRPSSGPNGEDSPAAGIRGISGEAEIGYDGTRDVARRAHQDDQQNDKPQQKGKGKADEQEEDDAKENEERLSPRLKPDEMFIPDKDA